MKKILLLLFFVLFIISCSENSVEPENSDFNVQILAKDGNGHSMPNINVSIWSKLHYDLTRELPEIDIDNTETRVGFSVVENSFIDLSVYDMNGEKQTTLVHGSRQAGTYEVKFDYITKITDRVSKIKMTASSDSLQNNILFQDSIYAVFNRPFPTLSFVGKTRENGSFEVNNKLLFPHLLSLPTLYITAENNPDSIGTFTFADTVIIALSNETFTESVIFERAVVNRNNYFELGWENGTSWNNITNTEKSNKEKKPVSHKILQTETPTDWRLYQNYPNPI